MIKLKKKSKTKVITYSLDVYSNGNHINNIDVIETHLPDGMFGQYDIENNILSLSVILNKMPNFKKFIMQHEVGHSFDKNILQVIQRDLRDYKKMYFTKSFLKFFQIQKQKLGGNIPYYKQLLQKYTYVLLIWILVMPISIIMGYPNFFKKRVKNKL